MARTVANIVADPNPTLRYRIGRTARMVPWLQMMPQRWFERFMDGQLGDRSTARIVL